MNMKQSFIIHHQIGSFELKLDIDPKSSFSDINSALTLLQLMVSNNIEYAGLLPNEKTQG